MFSSFSKAGMGCVKGCTVLYIFVIDSYAIYPNSNSRAITNLLDDDTEL